MTVLHIYGSAHQNENLADFKTSEDLETFGISQKKNFNSNKISKNLAHSWKQNHPKLCENYKTAREHLNVTKSIEQKIHHSTLPENVTESRQV